MWAGIPPRQGSTNTNKDNPTKDALGDGVRASYNEGTGHNAQVSSEDSAGFGFLVRR